jgi:hypothetical protein
MAGPHSAKSLFDQNIESAESCLKLYDGIEKLSSSLNISWLLRAAIVFAISALDAYFHDKVRYRAGGFGLQDMPPPMAEFQIPLRELTTWEGADRKGNVLRNWIVEHYSTRPLQRREDIAKALKLVGIADLWATIEPNSPKREALFVELSKYVKRRNQIAHEGDREGSRRSGKKLRSISRAYADDCIRFVKDLVSRIETAFKN